MAPRPGRGLRFLPAALLLVSAAPPAPSPPGQAAAGPARPGEPLRITLRDAIAMAVRTSPEAAILALRPRIAREGIRREKGRFDPVLGFEASVSHEERVTGSALEGATELVTDTRVARATLARPIETGGRIEALVETRRLHTNSAFAVANPFYDSVASVQLTQPVLRGAGPSIALAPISIARRGETVASHEFRERMMGLLLQIHEAYFGLSVLREAREVRRKALASAERALADAQARRRGGAATDLEVSEAEDRAWLAREALGDAEASLGDGEDLLREQILPAGDRREIVPAEAPVLPPLPGTEEDSEALALARRPAIAAAIERVRIAEEDLRLAENARLPRLDLVGSAGERGGSGRFSPGLRDTASGDHPAFSLGFAFSMPLGNRTADADARIRGLERREAELILERERRRVGIAARSARRALSRAADRLDRGEARIGIEERALAAERGRLAAGSGTALDVARAEDRLEEARLAAFRARIDAALARARLLREEGTLGDAWGFVFEGAGDAP